MKEKVLRLKQRDANELARARGRIESLKELILALNKIVSENGRSSLVSKDKIQDLVYSLEEKLGELENE